MALPSQLLPTSTGAQTPQRDCEDGEEWEEPRKFPSSLSAQQLVPGAGASLTSPPREGLKEGKCSHSSLCPPFGWIGLFFNFHIFSHFSLPETRREGTGLAGGDPVSSLRGPRCNWSQSGEHWGGFEGFTKGETL